MIPKILRDILTNADGTTFCHARLSGFIFTLVYIGMGIANFIMSHKFDCVEFATGYAAILASICGGAWMKKDTESK